MSNLTTKRLLLGGSLPIPSLDLNFLAGTLPAGVVFTRAAGVATYFDSAGVLQTARTNVLTNSQVFNSWPTKTDMVIADNNIAAPDGTLTAALVTCGVAGSDNLASNAGTVPANSTVSFSFYVKRGNFDVLHFYTIDTAAGANGFQAWLNIATGVITNLVLGGASGFTSAVVTLPDGWFRVTATCTLPVASTSAVLMFRTAASAGSGTRVNNGTYYIWGAQAEVGAPASAYIPTTSAANGAPRFDCEPVGGAPRGLLIEDTRTNLCAQSQNIAGWSLSGGVMTLTNNAAVSPLGTTTAARVETGDTSVGGHTVFITFAGVISTAYVASVYAKPDQYPRFTLYLGNTGFASVNTGALFDLVAGTVVTTAGGSTATIQPVGNGWYRLSVTATSDADGGTYVIAAVPAPATLATVGGGYTPLATGLGGWVFGAQIEAAAFASSYIPTAGGTVNRPADTASAAVGAWFNQTEGTLVADALVSQAAPSGSHQQLAQFDDGSDANRMTLRNFANGLTLGCSSVVASVVTATTAAAGSFTPGTPYRAGLRYAPGEIAAVFGGATPQLALGALPGSLTTLRLGNVFAAGATLNGCLRRMRYWNRALPATRLQQATRG